ncbi:hypothetical protein LFYK43_15910 [Ligilactobacillus salitolerans]|uniref:Cell surface protein n=1 Tax=Ligilactobacillus salitolerans TaxID=1808352 RepID=A0A401IUC4_9LACO|nr:CdaR family protein [Ligilactobacillus salitolerans]GBG95132.1 hypothetical protein LFYK43_15910 [Ligilactobacillus salitolerans]
MKLAQVFNSKIAYSLISLLFTVFLFVYVNSEQLSGGNNQSGTSISLMKNTRATVKKSPNLNYDSDKYYVSGAPQTVKVTLIGPSGLVKSAENTGNFQVNADLSGLKTGTHTVQLKTSGLSSELSSRVSPSSIKVKISKRAEATLPVQVRYDSAKIADGYAAGAATSSRQTVKVVGAKKDIKKIDSVVADVDLDKDAKKSTTKNVMLRAISSSGKQLDVTISPETARVNIPIYLASSDKKVPLKLVADGSGVDGKKYSLSSKTKYATLTGTKDALKKIDELEVPVSLAGVSDDQQRTISLASNRSGVTKVSPASVQVSIKVTDQSSSSSSSGASSSSSSTENNSSAAGSTSSQPAASDSDDDNDSGSSGKGSQTTTSSQSSSSSSSSSASSASDEAS